MKKNTFKPGQSAPASGQYGILGTKQERTVVRNEPLPPTPRSGQLYYLADPTKNKAGKPR